MYNDDDGRFKGDARVMYFKEESVELAIQLLDDTELEMGAGYGNMRVRVAEYDKALDGKKEVKKEPKVETGEEPQRKKPKNAEEKQNLSKRIKTMQKYVAAHVDREG